MDNIQRNFQEKSRLRRGDVPRNNPRWDRARMHENRNIRSGTPSSAGANPTSGAQTQTRTPPPGGAQTQTRTPPTSSAGSSPSRLRTAGNVAKGFGRAVLSPGALLATAGAQGTQYADGKRLDSMQNDIDTAFEEGRANPLKRTGPAFDAPGEPIEYEGEDLGDRDGFTGPAQAPEWARTAANDFQRQGAEPTAEPEAPGTPARDRTLRGMGVPQEAIDSAPIETEHRRAMLNPGGRGVAGQTYNLGNYGSSDEDANIYGTADENGRVNSFAGVGTRRRTDEQRMAEGRRAAAGVERAAEIAAGTNRLREARAGGGQNGGGISDAERTNRAFDRRRQELRNQFEGNSTGTGRAALAEAMNDLETERTEQLNNLRTNAGDTLRQRIAGDANRDVATINSQGDYQRELFKQSQLNARSRADAAADAAELQREMGKEGFDRYLDAVERASIDPETNEVDTEKRQRISTFIETTRPQVMSELLGGRPAPGTAEYNELPAAEQQQLIQDLIRMEEMNTVRNENVNDSMFGGPQTQSADRPVEVGEAVWGDVWNNDLEFKDWFQSNLPWTNKNVVRMQSGVSVPVDELIGDDAEKMRVVLDLIDDPSTPPEYRRELANMLGVKEGSPLRNRQ